MAFPAPSGKVKGQRGPERVGQDSLWDLLRVRIQDLHLLEFFPLSINTSAPSLLFWLIKGQLGTGNQPER